MSEGGQHDNAPTLSQEALLLRQRLGAGARFDASAAPAVELAWARLGTAYFARKLNELKDNELDHPTLIPGWSRRRLIAHVGHQARALTGVVEAARTGQPVQPASEEQILMEENGATLPARALRNLFSHAEVHLNVEWRDLGDADWGASVILPSGAAIPIRATPAIRARVVWIHAVDLNNLGSFSDFPHAFLEWLATDGLATPAKQGEPGFALELSDAQLPQKPAPLAVPIEGTLADIVRWLCGRGARRLTSADPDVLSPNPKTPGPLGLIEF